MLVLQNQEHLQHFERQLQSCPDTNRMRSYKKFSCNLYCIFVYFCCFSHIAVLLISRLKHHLDIILLSLSAFAVYDRIKVLIFFMKSQSRSLRSLSQCTFISFSTFNFRFLTRTQSFYRETTVSNKDALILGKILKNIFLCRSSEAVSF